MILAELGLDDITIAGALLHDSVEDTTLTIDDIDEVFGAEIAGIVDGVTKLDRLHFDSKEAQQAASLRKMLVAMARTSACCSSSSPTACTTCARSRRSRRRSSSGSPRRRSTSTRRSRTASASPT